MKVWRGVACGRSEIVPGGQIGMGMEMAAIFFFAKTPLNGIRDLTNVRGPMLEQYGLKAVSRFSQSET